jgi:hypothetical protein
MKNKTLRNFISLAIISVTAVFTLCVYGPLMALIATSALCAPGVRPQLGDNVIDADLNLNTFLDSALMAFKAAIMPITVFATRFNNIVLKGTDKVDVFYYPIDTQAAKDFSYDTGYVFDEDTNTAKREITIDNRKYVSMGLTSRDLARLPALNAEILGRLKGENLAYQILMDIMSVITHANFATDGLVSSTFDSDDVIDISTIASTLTTTQDGGGTRPTPWPKNGRGLVVNETYHGKLLKDTAFKSAQNMASDQAIRTATLPNILGFQYADSAAVPDNGENLVGFAAYMSAVLVGFSPIEPAAGVRKQLVDYRAVSDTDTGITLEYRSWGSPDYDTEKRTIECNYGFDVGEGKALLPIRSAAFSES